MGAFTNYLENKVLDHTLKGTAFTQPSNLYIALYTSDPTETGAAGTEVSGGSYARQAISFNAASSGTATNAATITFPTATASWGTVSHWQILDASTAGNPLIYGAFTASKTIATDDTFKINAGALSITLD